MASAKSILHLITNVINPPDFSIESLDSVENENTKKIKQLVKQKNIIGIGISEKISKRRKTGKIGMTFYVEKKIDIKDIRPQEMIPKNFLQLNDPAKAILTDVIEIGKILPQVNIAQKLIQPGFSIGHFKGGNGTIGAIVTDGKQNYVLSNSHVIALNGKAKKGDVILYPSAGDGGNLKKNSIATLQAVKKFIKSNKFINEVDCAIALPAKEREKDITAFIKEIGLPKGIINPKRGMKVLKAGRSTGKTKSEIIDANFNLKIDYGTLGEIGFTHQILCKAFTEDGDSGSLVIDAKTKKAVGLHFAGGPKGSVSNPIQKVLDALGVKLVLAKK